MFHHMLLDNLYHAPHMDMQNVMKAIDLYAGIGGWSLGLKLAGIDIVRSFEWWKPAARTHSANLSGDVHIVDIRTMPLELVNKPNGSRIDIVVGSPPCTQFSYSNRGGSGDVSDGLIDIYRFMEVLRIVKPRFWAFENVPRVAKVIFKEASNGGALADFVDLFEKADVQVLDMSDFGVPQRRKRCIVGNIPFALLDSYKEKCPQVTLGEVLNAVSSAKDPIYSRGQNTDISDIENEAFLSDEEERFNKDMKSAHPVYNGMAFPEPLDRASRTVTATCTRVSRESLVVGDPLHKGRFRRLSVRERASLQGFPVDYQFHGSSHAEKLKMIGNAIPPAFTYFVAHSMLGTKPQKLPALSQRRAADLIKASTPIVTKPDRAGRSYPPTRRFRFSIPNFRFKSGTRFELSNVADAFSWQVRFFYGDSKRIGEHVFDFDSLIQAANEVDATIAGAMERARKSLSRILPRNTSKELQLAWSHQTKGPSAFVYLDKLGDAANEAFCFDEWAEVEQVNLEEILERILSTKDGMLPVGIAKLRRNARAILEGAVLSVESNKLLEAELPHAVAAE